MVLSIRCPAGHLLRVADKYAGRKLRCPKCQQITAVPLAEPAEVPTAAPSGVSASAKAPPTRQPPPAVRPSAVPPPLKPQLSTKAKSPAAAGAANTAAKTPRAAVVRQGARPLDDQPALPSKSVERPPPTDGDEPSPRTKRDAKSSEQKQANVVSRRKLREKKASAARKPQPLGYRADVHRRQTVLLLGLGWLLLSVFQAAPAWQFLDVSLAPGWARVVLVIALIELAYAAWMVTVPDWSTVWVAMIVLTVVAAVYGAGMAVALFTPRDTPVVLDLDDKRGAAAPWCAAVILLTCLMTYFCGRVGHRWHKVYQAGR